MFQAKYYRNIFILMTLSLTLMLSACGTAPPDEANNVCKIFRQYPSWYWATQATQKKWGVPISVQMAIIYEESGYHDDAQPAREKLLWVIPWFRPTSAYGYCQALDETWDGYKRQTGNHFADRDTFKDASDFIGWYASIARTKAGISSHNAKQLYLAYHEGVGGYMRATYKSKTWLIHVANKVQRFANIYHQQLIQCQSSLPQKHWWQFWK